MCCKMQKCSFDHLSSININIIMQFIVHDCYTLSESTKCFSIQILQICFLVYPPLNNANYVVQYDTEDNVIHYFMFLQTV